MEGTHINQSRAASTANVFDLMAGEITETAQANERISAASQEQIGQFKTLCINLDELFETLQSNTSKVEVTANISDDLYRVTQQLNALMSEFRFEHTLQEQLRVPGEKRRNPRFPQSLLIHTEFEGKVLDGVTSDLSLSGMQLRLHEVLPKGSLLSFSLKLPGADGVQYAKQEPLKLEGRICRRHAQDGCQYYGIEFVGMQPATVARLKTCFQFFHRQAEYVEAAASA